MTYLEHLKANWKVAFHSLDDFLEHFLHGLIPYIRWRHIQPDNVLNYDRVSSNSIEPVIIRLYRSAFPALLRYSP